MGMYISDRSAFQSRRRFHSFIPHGGLKRQIERGAKAGKSARGREGSGDCWGRQEGSDEEIFPAPARNWLSEHSLLLPCSLSLFLIRGAVSKKATTGFPPPPFLFPHLLHLFPPENRHFCRKRLVDVKVKEGPNHLPLSTKPRSVQHAVYQQFANTASALDRRRRPPASIPPFRFAAAAAAFNLFSFPLSTKTKACREGCSFPPPPLQVSCFFSSPLLSSRLESNVPQRGTRVESEWEGKKVQLKGAEGKPEDSAKRRKAEPACLQLISLNLPNQLRVPYFNGTHS